MAKASTVPAVMPSHSVPLPAGAVDTHNHLFGPQSQFPLLYPPDYPVPDAPLETYLEMLDRVGFEKGVLVQTTQQGTDNSILLRALEASGSRLRAVFAAEANIDDGELLRWSDAGVAGLRFVEAPLPNGAPRPGSVPFSAIPELAERMGDHGMSLNLWAPNTVLMEKLDGILQFGLPTVIEHMGMLDLQQGIRQAAFQRLLGLLSEGCIWIKLSFTRICKTQPLYADVRPFLDSLLAANSDRLVWGSDWPFVRMVGTEPDVSQLLHLFKAWQIDDALMEKILVTNPARLYLYSNSNESN